MYRATFQGETLDEILRLMKLTVPMKYIEKTSEKAMPNGVLFQEIYRSSEIIENNYE